MRYRVVLYPMLNQTLAVVSSLHEDADSERKYESTYTLKTYGDTAWPVPHLLRELADAISAQEF